MPQANLVGIFFSWDSLFPKNSSLCQADVKLASTHRFWSWGTGNEPAGTEENWCAQELAPEQFKGHAKLQPPQNLKKQFLKLSFTLENFTSLWSLRHHLIFRLPSWLAPAAWERSVFYQCALPCVHLKERRLLTSHPWSSLTSISLGEFRNTTLWNGL